MARLLSGNPDVRTLSASVFSPLVERAREAGMSFCPLHEGDTHRIPPHGACLWDGATYAIPNIHKYSPIRGRPELIDAIVEHREAKNGRPLSRAEVLVTAGATGGLSAAVRTLLAPGQTVVALAPYWPLIRGIVQSHGVGFVEVPFYDRGHDPHTIAQALKDTSDATVAAVYVNWPNNPTGCIPSANVAEAIAAFACERDLWVFSDEVYEDYIYSGTSPPLISCFPGMTERTLRFFSFSKMFGMAGNRVGYLLGASSVVDAVERYTTFAVYSVSSGGQVAAARAIREGETWLRDARTEYMAMANAVALPLGVQPPAGGCFLFLDVAPVLDERGLGGLLEDLADLGIVVAAGPVCGSTYSTWIRVCFTCLPEKDVMRGVNVIASRIACGSPRPSSAVR